ncbi:hypothetical protein G3I41_26530, partial [Streptomyces sp. SID9727]|nr:hypothetical protein [Streptomyces sp. SID9727]
MGDQDQRAGVPRAQQPAEQAENPVPGERIEPGGDLVAHRDPGAGENRAGRGRAPEFAAGQAGGEPHRRFRREPECAQQRE